MVFGLLSIVVPFCAIRYTWKMFGDFKKQAKYYVKQDHVRNYSKALPLYMNALEYFKTHLKYEKNPEIKEAIQKKLTEYLRHAEEIHAIIEGRTTVVGLERANQALQEAIILPVKFPRFFTGQRRNMSSQTQSTPNLSSLMSYPGKPVMDTGSSDFPNAHSAMNSPLEKAIYGVDGVTRVFLGSDFVAVTKSENVSWDIVKPEISAAIMGFYSPEEALFLDSKAAASKDTAIHKDDSETVAMIKEMFETRICPAVQYDGGDIEYRGFDLETGIVKLRMQGASSGCPSSSVTLKSGIENMLMHYVPEVKGVEQDLDGE